MLFQKEFHHIVYYKLPCTLSINFGKIKVSRLRASKDREQKISIRVKVHVF